MGEALDWSSVLSLAECQLLSIARALIANFEFLILHKPTAQLTPAASTRVLETLREFVSKRGVVASDENTDQSIHGRQPRTCLITEVSIDPTRICDRVLALGKHGVEDVTNEQLLANYYNS